MYRGEMNIIVFKKQLNMFTMFDRFVISTMFWTNDRSAAVEAGAFDLQRPITGGSRKANFVFRWR